MFTTKNSRIPGFFWNNFYWQRKSKQKSRPLCQKCQLCNKKAYRTFSWLLLLNKPSRCGVFKPDGLILKSIGRSTDKLISKLTVKCVRRRVWFNLPRLKASNYRARVVVSGVRVRSSPPPDRDAQVRPWLKRFLERGNSTHHIQTNHPSCSLLSRLRSARVLKCQLYNTMAGNVNKKPYGMAKLR